MHDNGKGYVEDRRPASNIDPYIVTAIMYDTGVLSASGKGAGLGSALSDHYLSWDKWIKTIVVATP